MNDNAARRNAAGHAVVIAGGGPTGLMLAAELALAGIDVAIVERRAGLDLHGRRAGGLHARTLELLDQRGIADRFLSQGKVFDAVGFHMTPLDISDFPTRHNYVLQLRQAVIERILADRVAELGVPVCRGLVVTGFTQDDDGVDVALSDGRSLRAGYLVGCDGGRSVVRKAAAIDFAGWDPTTSWLIAEVDTAEEPQWGFHRDAIGIHAIGRREEGSGATIVLTEPQLQPGTEPDLDDVKNALVAIYGTDFGVHSPTWISRFTDVTRQATSYRNRRVLLAGDAAHVHPPIGGQGLNVGVHDAVNLGWKLAQVVKGTSPHSLLDSYHTERHPVAARVLRSTMAQVALRRTDDRTHALVDTVAELLTLDEPRRHLAAEISGLGVRYDAGGGHPMLGRRMPDLDIETRTGAVRVFTLLHRGAPLLLNFGAARSRIGAWADRVDVVDARYAGEWALPAIGVVPAPGAVLVRPDGYVAWVGDGTDSGLVEALTTWFGPTDPDGGR